jgi:hypothetical protein
MQYVRTFHYPHPEEAMKQSTFRLSIPIAALIFTFVLTACIPPSPPVKETGARVFFTNLLDGDTASNPLKVTMGSESFVIQPSGDIVDGTGHLHILVDADCTPVGEVVIKDETHLHYGKGQLEAELILTPGQHTLCLQAANGAHIALPGEGMTQKVTVTVQ